MANGASGGATTTVQPSTLTTTTWTMTLPSATGSNGQVLQTDGSGNTSWVNQTALGITALTGDVTATGSGSTASTVVKVNGVSYASSPSNNTVPVVTAANTVTYEALPNAALANSSVTLGSTAVSLGATASSLAALNSVGLGVNGTTTGY